MNVFTIFAQRFGSVTNAVQFLKMNGIQVNTTRYREWTEGKYIPKRNVLNLIMRLAIEHLYGEIKDGVSL